MTDPFGDLFGQPQKKKKKSSNPLDDLFDEPASGDGLPPGKTSAGGWIRGELAGRPGLLGKAEDLGRGALLGATTGLPLIAETTAGLGSKIPGLGGLGGVRDWLAEYREKATEEIDPQGVAGLIGEFAGQLPGAGAVYAKGYEAVGKTILKRAAKPKAWTLTKAGGKIIEKAYGQVDKTLPLGQRALELAKRAPARAGANVIKGVPIQLGIAAGQDDPDVAMKQMLIGVASDLLFGTVQKSPTRTKPNLSPDAPVVPLPAERILQLEEIKAKAAERSVKAAELQKDRRIAQAEWQLANPDEPWNKLPKDKKRKVWDEYMAAKPADTNLYEPGTPEVESAAATVEAVAEQIKPVVEKIIEENPEISPEELKAKIADDPIVKATVGGGREGSSVGPEGSSGGDAPAQGPLQSDLAAQDAGFSEANQNLKLDEPGLAPDKLAERNRIYDELDEAGAFERQPGDETGDSARRHHQLEVEYSKIVKQNLGSVEHLQAVRDLVDELRPPAAPTVNADRKVKAFNDLSMRLSSEGETPELMKQLESAYHDLRQNHGLSDDQIAEMQARIAENEDIISEMRTGEGRVGAGFDKSLFKKLGANLYKGNIASVAAKEGLQNAIDAVRPLINRGEVGEIAITIDSRQDKITFVDNGIGMPPEVMEKEFMDVGGSYKEAGEGMSGGYGLAKVGLFSGARDIDVRSVADTPEGRVMTMLQGSGDDWVEGNIRMEVIPVGPDHETGTYMSLQLSEKAGIFNVHDWFSVTNWLKEAKAHNRTGARIAIAKTDSWLGTNEVIEQGTLNNDNYEAPFNVDVPGAKVQIRAAKTLNAKEGTSIKAAVLNNGLFQFFDHYYLSGTPKRLPELLFVEVHPSVGVEDAAYPFTTSREELKGDVKSAIEKFVKTLGDKTGRRDAQHIFEIMQDSPTIPGNPSTKVFHTDPAVPRKLIDEIAVAKYAGAINKAMSAIMSHVVTAAKLKYPGIAIPHYGGFYTSDGSLGVNVRRKAIQEFIKEAGMEVKQAVAGDNMILFNPWVTFKEIISDVGVRSNNTNLIDQLAESTIGTAIHEMAHQISRGHNEEYAGVLTRILSFAGRFHTESYNEASSAWERVLNEHGTEFNSHYDQLTEAWGKSGKQNVFKNFAQHSIEDTSHGGRASSGDDARRIVSESSIDGERSTQSGLDDTRQVVRNQSEAPGRSPDESADRSQRSDPEREALVRELAATPIFKRGPILARIKELNARRIAATPEPAQTTIPETPAVAASLEAGARSAHSPPVESPGLSDVSELIKQARSPRKASDENLKLIADGLHNKQIELSELISQYEETARQIELDAAEATDPADAKVLRKRADGFWATATEATQEASDQRRILNKILEEQAFRAKPPGFLGDESGGSRIPPGVSGALAGFGVGYIIPGDDEHRMDRAWMGLAVGAAAGHYAGKRFAAGAVRASEPHERTPAELPGGDWQAEVGQHIVTGQKIEKRQIPVLEKIRAAYYNVIRRSYVGERFMETLGASRLPTMHNAAKLMSMFGRWTTMSEQAMKHGPSIVNEFGETKHLGAASPQEIFNDIGGDVETLGTLMAARTKLEMGDAVKTPFDAIAANNAFYRIPELYHKAADKARQLALAMADVAVDGHMLSREARELFATETFYSSLERIFPSTFGGATSSAEKGQLDIVKAVSPLKERKGGSSAKIRNGFETLVQSIPRIYRGSELNKVKLAFVDAWEATGKDSQLMKRISAKDTGHQTEHDNYVKQLRSEIKGLSNTDAHSLVAALDPSAIDVKKGTMRVFRNGQVESYKIPRELARAILTLSPDELHPIISALGMPARIPAKGITMHPFFIAKMGFFDMFQATLNSQYGFRPGIENIRGWMHIMAGSEKYRRLAAAGLGHQYLGGANLEAIGTTMESLAQQQGSQATVALRHLKEARPLEFYNALVAPIGDAARVGEALRALDHGASTIDAVFAGKQVTANYNEIGAWSGMKGLQHMTMFLGPSLQVMDQAAYRGGIHPFRVSEEGRVHDAVRYSLKAFATIAMPSWYFWHAAQGDDDIKELRGTKGGHKWWYYRLPWNVSGYGDKGTIIKIPKPILDGQIFGTTMERLLDQQSGQDPEGWSKISSSVAQDAAFNLLPSVGVIPLSLAAGQDLSRNIPIVPKGDEGLQLEHRGENRSSWLARDISKQVSPYVQNVNIPLLQNSVTPAGLDYLFNAVGGMLGQDAVLAVSHAVEFEKTGYVPAKQELPIIKNVFAAYPATNVRSLQEFYDRADRVEKVGNTINHLIKENPDQLMGFMESNEKDYSLVGMFAKTREEIAGYRRAIYDLKALPTSFQSSADRRAAIAEYQTWMIEAARDANEVVKDMDAPDAAPAQSAPRPVPQKLARPISDLQGLDPAVAPRFQELLDTAKEQGIQLRVLETRRSAERQSKLYAQGRTAPGPVVTWTLNSKHIPGRAIDFDGTPSALRWLQNTAPQLGFRVLGSKDPGHVEIQ